MFIFFISKTVDFNVTPEVKKSNFYEDLEGLQLMSFNRSETERSTFNISEDGGRVPKTKVLNSFK
jgi:hypothetical protein